ncbi:hypothetical protein Drose_27015 [Dactylosporangium roseum]|uniref:HpcH/HpaI aldolase/citrate lyase domain-containing protein n=1 Tax=Dactylosporangium roseum TaxID=47989 RepID=A0ABY5YYJ6_9ACTN|nr:aldolase/citrate lyase family protein [Dactylosporangium roseum]UWZ34820.1 hypothetical protein Drose_27015 [Dactylosporangium roseum]
MTAHDQSLAARLRGRDTLLGLVVKMPAASLIEAAGHLGWDLVIIDTEHGAADTMQLEGHLRAADSAGIAAVVRVGSHRPEEILRALDAGASGVVVPHVNTPEQARAVAAAAHYPPDGHRSLATSTRAGRHSTQTLAAHIERARHETVVIVQIEDRSAISVATQIAATPHVDGVWIGLTDLSMSLGLPGDYTHPEVAAAVAAVVDGVTSAGSAALCALADSEQDVAHWHGLGATVVLFVASQLFARRLREIAVSKASVAPTAPDAEASPQTPGREYEPSGTG